MLIKTHGFAVYGIEALPITVETNIDSGINFFLVGLPDSAVKESHQRIKAAFTNSNLKFPKREITINMAPADIQKEGSAYDLTIATGILAASDQIKPDRLNDYVIMGEVSLDGGLRPIKGALPMAIAAKKKGFKGFILPKQNAQEVAIVDGLETYGISHIQELVEFFNEERIFKPEVFIKTEQTENETELLVDFFDVKGQENA